MTRLLKLKLGALLVASAAVGCGGSYSALCEDEMDCRGGNDADIDACIVRYEHDEERAVIDGCEEEWDDWIVCLEEEAQCNDALNVFAPDITDCVGEAVDLNDCLD